MSRSVYDPPPNFSTCSDCQQEIDEAYYGPHLCEERLAKLMRRAANHGVDVRAIAERVSIQVAKEKREFELEQERVDRERKKKKLEDAKAEVARLEKELG